MNAPGLGSCRIWTSRNWRPFPTAADGRRTGGETSPDWECATRSRASVVDDHSRLAYSEALPDEKAPTVVAFTLRVLEFYREYGITHIQEIMTDDHPGYTHSLGFKALLPLQGIPDYRAFRRRTSQPRVQSPPPASRDQAPDHQALQPPAERESGTLPPNPQTKMGQPAGLAQRRNQNPGPSRLAPPLPQPPTPHPPRRKTTHRQTGNNLVAGTARLPVAGIGWRCRGAGYPRARMVVKPPVRGFREAGPVRGRWRVPGRRPSAPWSPAGRGSNAGGRTSNRR